MNWILIILGVFAIAALGVAIDIDEYAEFCEPGTILTVNDQGVWKCETIELCLNNSDCTIHNLTITGNINNVTIYDQNITGDVDIWGYLKAHSYSLFNQSSIGVNTVEIYHENALAPSALYIEGAGNGVFPIARINSALGQIFGVYAHGLTLVKDIEAETAEIENITSTNINSTNGYIKYVEAGNVVVSGDVSASNYNSYGGASSLVYSNSLNQWRFTSKLLVDGGLNTTGNLYMQNNNISDAYEIRAQYLYAGVNADAGTFTSGATTLNNNILQSDQLGDDFRIYNTDPTTGGVLIEGICDFNSNSNDLVCSADIETSESICIDSSCIDDWGDVNVSVAGVNGSDIMPQDVIITGYVNYTQSTSNEHFGSGVGVAFHNINGYAQSGAPARINYLYRGSTAGTISISSGSLTFADVTGGSGLSLTANAISLSSSTGGNFDMYTNGVVNFQRASTNIIPNRYTFVGNLSIGQNAKLPGFLNRGYNKTWTIQTAKHSTSNKYEVATNFTINSHSPDGQGTNQSSMPSFQVNDIGAIKLFTNRTGINCNSATLGTIRFDEDADNFYGCTSRGWINMTGLP